MNKYIWLCYKTVIATQILYIVASKIIPSVITVQRNTF